MNVIKHTRLALTRLISCRCRTYVLFTHSSQPYVSKICKKICSPFEPFCENALNFRYSKCFSSCSSMKTEDSSADDDKSNTNFVQKAFDDEEFRNILSDFAKDFGVESDSNKALDEIRKQIEFDDSKLHSTKDGKDANTCTDQHFDVYKEFKEADASVIHSYEDSQFSKYESELHYHIDQETNASFIPEKLERGNSGVYDIHELIEALRKENLVDIATIAVPKKFHYADFLVLATAKSPRHIKAVAEFIIKLYKKKKNEVDRFPIIEGEDVDNWKAIDLGNIVLHVFLEETRIQYDIESLWLFDPEYDSGGSFKADPTLDIIEEQMAFFNSLQQQSSEMPKDVS